MSVQPDAELDLLSALKPSCVCVHLELSCGKSSMSDVLIPGRQTTDFTVSFWDYPDFRSILDIPILTEMCGHMFKCQRMSLQSKQ